MMQAHCDEALRLLQMNKSSAPSFPQEVSTLTCTAGFLSSQWYYQWYLVMLLSQGDALSKESCSVELISLLCTKNAAPRMFENKKIGTTEWVRHTTLQPPFNRLNWRTCLTYLTSSIFSLLYFLSSPLSFLLLSLLLSLSSFISPLLSSLLPSSFSFHLSSFLISSFLCSPLSNILFVIACQVSTPDRRKTVETLVDYNLPTGQPIVSSGDIFEKSNHSRSADLISSLHLAVVRSPTAMCEVVWYKLALTVALLFFPVSHWAKKKSNIFSPPQIVKNLFHRPYVRRALLRASSHATRTPTQSAYSIHSFWRTLKISNHCWLIWTPRSSR